MTEFWRLSAVKAVELLKKGDVTPLDLIDDALARINAVNPKVNAIVTLCAERARDHAKRLMAKPIDQRGPLCGLPFGVKELNDVAGVRTTYGSPIFTDNVPVKSDIMVEKLEENGGIVLGMTNTPEFGAGANTFNEVHGETYNPWNTKLNAGGSSGGAAVALATGQVWLATGSDLGGSLRTPAAFCSVVGLRPSPGRVPSGPGELRFDTLSVDGPMARNVTDTALMLDAMAGWHIDIPVSFPAPTEPFLTTTQRRLKPSRIAFCLDPAGLPIEPGVKDICRKALDKLSAAGLNVEEATPDFSGVGNAFQTLRAADYAATMRALLNQHRAKLKDEVIWNAEKGLKLTGEEIGKAHIRRSRLYADMVKLFETYDLLILPAAPILPRDIKERWPREINGEQLDNYVEWLKLAALITMTSCPVLSLPCGFSPDGRPMGLQLVGKPRGEGALLSHALVCEEILGIRDLVPIDPRG
ncbi:MAG: amidase [Rhodospirillaceae bacterium]|nr:amidase [Rhodospirillaceae bacterium]